MHNLNIPILILLTILLYLCFKKMTNKIFLKTEASCLRTKNEYESLLKENTKLKEENTALEKAAEDTIVLYDITREICKSLDEDKVFNNFCQQLRKYIEVGDCKFLKEGSDLSQYKNYEVLPLKIETHLVGYLVANQIKEKDLEKFHILTQQFLLGIKRAHLYKRVQELAIMDGLTGVFSRRFLWERFNEELERSKRFKYNFSFLMMDIDHFKECNDQYGHLVGDSILRVVSQIMKENIRQIDLVGRFGGEEFSIVLTETDKAEARQAAERIRKAIEQKHIRVYDEDLQVTLSVGISGFPKDASEAQALIERADEALYQAKKAGRNRVCVYERPGNHA